MPDRVSARIAVAFAVVGPVVALTVGAGLFVGLRTLHEEATIGSLGDVAQPILARVRAVSAVSELRPVLTALRSEVRPNLGIYVVAGARVVTAEAGEAPVDVGSIPLGRDLRAGESVGGELLAKDGTRVLYSATVVRREGAVVGPLALVLTTPDRSAALALRDLARVLPAVVLVTALVAIPIAWLLARSITRPLRRLAEATAAVPVPGATPTPPLVPEGPREVRDLTRRFNAMTAELDRIRTEERELLANVRHDLKTPLTVVTGFAEALRDGTATGDGVAAAGDAIAQEAGRMGRLVEDLRSIDELGTGGVALRPEALDPGAMTAAAVARFAPRAAASGVELRAGAGGGLALTADRGAVERILGNLIDNALAASRPGGQVLVEALGAASGAIAFRVSDDGPGFPPGSLERAFDRFYRADSARVGPGTGLGLSIVRALALAHGGEAIAENLAPTGARVTVTLPDVPAAS
jgi:signal transduction histidine kinase